MVLPATNRPSFSIYSSEVMLPLSLIHILRSGVMTPTLEEEMPFDSLQEAFDEGVRQGYLEGKLRCSVVGDPLRRVNTNDNTPAVLHLKLVPGEQVKIVVAPKGFGSENMSAMKMFTPSASREDIIDFVVGPVSYTHLDVYKRQAL